MNTRTKNGSMKQKKSASRPPIHWTALGAGLITASFLYPEQQYILLSLGFSGVIVGQLERRSMKRATHQAAS